MSSLAQKLSGKVSDRLGIYDFGHQLLETRDLDPVYVVLHEAKLQSRELERWLLAYWCFYHSGTASWIADTPMGYWSRMGEAAASREYPRCHERRHFRGKAAVASVAWLKDRGLDSLWDPLRVGEASLEEVMAYVRSWRQFGPWIAFKVADMLERLGLCRVEFSTGAMFLFDSPKEGAELLWGTETGDLQGFDASAEEWAVDRILNELGDQLAPPRYEREINAQEAETILCKWKSHMGGHYRIGEDVEATQKGLLRFPDCEMSHRLLEAGRDACLWL